MTNPVLALAVLEAAQSAAYAGTVYLLHFDRPYRHARHYVGWTVDLPGRMSEHAKEPCLDLVDGTHAVRHAHRVHISQ